MYVRGRRLRSSGFGGRKDRVGGQGRRLQASDLGDALAAWVAGDGGCKALVVEAAWAALVSMAGECTAAEWRHLRKDSNCESADCMAASVAR